MTPAKKKFLIVAAGGAAIIVYAIVKLVLTLGAG
jgi:hypothetical protein